MDMSAARPRVARLMLQQFRSYPGLDLAIDAPLVALTGENGAGKTNLLEALSLFSPGRGLRRADLADMSRIGSGGGFAVSLTLDEPSGGTRLGTGIEPRGPGEGAQRRCRIDGEPVPTPAAFADRLRLVWLTPALDGLFAGSPGDRRRFLDRLVLAVDAGHGARANAFERALRSRNRLLEEDRPNAAWLDAVEREVAELGVAIASARREAADRLAVLTAERNEASTPFPWAALTLDGEIEAMVADRPALDVEDHYRRLLRDGRARDRAAGRTLAGPQTTDLAVRHGPKDTPASLCSTGEQKALLIGIVLAHARLVAAMSGIAPLVLLDEIAAHLDPRRRQALYDALAALGSQVWMTGADPALFGELPATAAILRVTPGRVSSGA
ncbi:DNA replication/repair protein RecF [Chelatococcus reniformis]|uniref:DNA replication and repair protein RecF n=1 Tax=Chelatococcus reniformis TaxID=1494448 RepID=A0A916UAF7_9HYPH|nr:DNA replication/repair protein RecF [Chelatococcus reniformis]GGC65732.1 DNA replication and repair protein RecF [Chelatococcus reniformis]